MKGHTALPDCKHVAILRMRSEGYTHREIASILGLHVKTVQRYSKRKRES